MKDVYFILNSYSLQNLIKNDSIPSDHEKILLEEVIFKKLNKALCPTVKIRIYEI